MQTRLEVGQVYIATAAIEGQRRRLAVVIGRAGYTIQLAFVGELATGKAQSFGGDREFAQVDTAIGRYNLSSMARASAAEAAEIQEILKSERNGGAR